MKKITLLLAFVASMISGGAFAQNVFFSDVQFESGTDNNKASLEISVDAGEQYAAGLELVITFPEGISVEKGKRGYVSTIEDIADGFSATINLRENGDFYVAVTNNNNWEFLETAGKVITLSLVKDANLGDGVYTANVHDIILCTAADENFQVSQINDVTEATFNIAVGEVAAVPYYLVGNMTSWGVDAAYQLTKNDAAETEEYMITLDLADDAQFKIAKSDDGITIADDAWYPGGMGNAYGEHGELAEAGNYTVYFRPNADGGDGWFNNLIYVVTNSTVGIRGINVDGTNGDIYNTAGQRVVKAGKGLYIQNGKKVVKK